MNRTMKAVAIKPDVEGEYVAHIIDRQRDIPRSLPDGSLRKLYFLSPNSSYSIFVGFVFLPIEGLFFSQLQDPHDGASMPMVMIMGAPIVLVGFGLPLINMRQVRYAIQYGVDTIGTVNGIRPGQTTAYSTAEGMRNGSIKAVTSYDVNGQPYRSEVFINRPWVHDVKVGTQLGLLVDPNKPAEPYVVGIAEQKHRWFAKSS